MTTKKRKAQLLASIDKGLVTSDPFKPKSLVMQVDHPSGHDYLIDGAPVSQSIFMAEMENQKQTLINLDTEEEYY